MYNTLQHNIPTFVKSYYEPVIWKGREYKFGEHFPWKELFVPEEVAEVLFSSGQIYHNPDLEVEQKVGDGLESLTPTNLDSLIRRINGEIKSKITTTNEYNSKKIKLSKVREKQIALIRTWKRANQTWVEMIDYMTEQCEDLLSSQAPKEE